jgi:hypothetical protein
MAEVPNAIVGTLYGRDAHGGYRVDDQRSGFGPGDRGIPVWPRPVELRLRGPGTGALWVT